MSGPRYTSIGPLVATVGQMSTFAMATAAGTDITFTLEPTKHEKWIQFLMSQPVPGSDPPITFMELYDITQKMTQDQQQPAKRKR